MSDYCWDCTERIHQLPGKANDFRLPWYWPWRRTRAVLCEGCGEIEVDRQGRQVSKNYTDKEDQR